MDCFLRINRPGYSTYLTSCLVPDLIRNAVIARLGLPEKTARLRSARLGARDMVHARMELACVTVVGLDTIAHPRIAHAVVVGMAPARCVLISFTGFCALSLVSDSFGLRAGSRRMCLSERVFWPIL